MTTATAELSGIFGRSTRSARNRRLLRRRLLRRAFIAEIPVSDWIALGLVGWMLAMVGWAVQLAKWGDLPNIVPTALIGALVAFFMSRVQIPTRSVLSSWGLPFKILAFIASGIVIVFWQGSLNAEGTNPIARSVDAWDRFEIWIDIAVNGGISADQSPSPCSS